MLFPATRFRLAVHAECGSTQELVLAQRGTPDFAGAAALALRQTNGVGRRGRSWSSEPGNLALSLGIMVTGEEALPLLTFACGLALHTVCARYVAAEKLRLKWPNDLYLDGRKLSGLLAQGRQLPGVGSEVVVGVGVNLAWAPDGLEPAAVALAEFATAPSPETFARELLAELEQVFARTREFSQLRRAWEAAARLHDGPLWVLGEGEPVYAEELLPTGELSVRDSRGKTRKLASEEVSLRFSRAAGAV